MQFGEAFISLIPQLDQSAATKTAADAKAVGSTAGTGFGKSFDDNAAKATNGGGWARALDTLKAKAGLSGSKAGEEFVSGFDKKVGPGEGSKQAAAFAEAFTKRVNEITKKVNDVSVRANTAEAEREVTELAVKLSKLGETRIGVRTDTAEAKRELASIEVAVAKLSKDVKVKVDVDTNSATKQMGQLNKETAAMSTAIVALGPLAVPAFAAVSGAAIGLGSVIGGVGAAIGLFGAAVKTVFGEAKKQSDSIDNLKKKVVDLDDQIKEANKTGADTQKLEEQRTKLLDQISAAYTAMGPNIHRVADAYGNLKGAWQEFIDANGPAVYGFLTKGMDGIAANIGKLQPLMDIASAAATKLLDKLVEFGNNGGLEKLVAYLAGSASQAMGNLGTIAKNLGITLANMFKGFDPAGQSFLKWLADATTKLAAWSAGDGLTKFIQYFKDNAGDVGSLLLEIASSALKIAEAVAPLAPITLAIAKGLSALINAVPVPVLTTIIGLFVAYNTALVAYNTYVAISTVATKAWAATQVVVSAATKVWAAGQWLLNAALTANPIGIVVVAIAALVAAIVLAYKNSDTFREIVDKAWAAIKVAIGATVDWFVKTAWPALKTAWDAVATAAKWLWENAIKPAWGGIKIAVEVAWTAIKAIFEFIKPALEAYGAVYTWLWKNIIVPAWDGIKTATATWWEGMKIVFNAVKPVLEALGTVFTWLWKNIIVPVWEGIKLSINTSWEAIKLIFNAAKPVVEALGAVFKWLWDYIIKPVWEGIKLSISTSWEAIKVIFNAVISFLQVTFQSAWNGFRLTVQTIWDAIKVIITTWWDGIKLVFEAVITFLSTTFKAAWDTFKMLVETTWNLIKTAISVAWEAIKAVFNTIITFLATVFKAAWDKFKTDLTTLWEAIKLMISTAWTWLKDNVFTPIMNYLKDPFMVAWNLFKTGLTVLWDAVKTMISTAWTWLKENVFNPIIAFLKDPLLVAWETFKTTIGNIWETIKNLLKSGWDFIKANVFDPIVNFVTKDIPNAFTKGVDAVKTAWEKIQDAVKVPVKFVVDTVINGGIIKGFNWVAGKVGADTIDEVKLNFARGGVLPGYTPGRDVHQFRGRAGTLNLSGGEAIMRPEWTRAMGAGFVNFMNRMARTGGVSGVRKAMGVLSNGGSRGGGHFASGGVMNFADGGIVKGLMSAWDALTDPVEAFKKFISSQVGNIPGVGALSKNLLPKTIEKLIGGVTGWIGEKFKHSTAGGASAAIGGSGGGAGMGYQKQMEILRAVFPGLALNSGYRPGSITSSGNLSYHASGRAVDVPPRWDVFNWIKANYGSSTKELIFGPAGSGGIYNGREHRFSDQLLSEHFDHVHWAMKLGGVLSGMVGRMFGGRGKTFSYDQGGIFNPGDVGVNNLSQPEAVLTPDETRGLKNMGTGELIDLLRELIEVAKTIAPDLGNEINGMGSRLIVKNRTR